MLTCSSHCNVLARMRAGFSRGKVSLLLFALVLAFCWNQIYIPIHLASADHISPQVDYRPQTQNHTHDHNHRHGGHSAEHHHHKHSKVASNAPKNDPGKSKENKAAGHPHEHDDGHQPHSTLDHLCALVSAVYPDPSISLFLHKANFFAEEFHAALVIQSQPTPSSRGPPSRLI